MLERENTRYIKQLQLISDKPIHCFWNNSSKSNLFLLQVSHLQSHYPVKVIEGRRILGSNNLKLIVDSINFETNCNTIINQLLTFSNKWANFV